MSIVKRAVYIVATPIGNLGDISVRAREVLGGVDLIAAEDTRHSARLLQHLGISTPMFALHEHNELGQCAGLLQRVADGASLALISDAGTPLLSDPGYHLVRGARAQGLRVIPIPGPSALLAALSAAGLPTDRFVFEGFLPPKAVARRRRLETLAGETRTLVLFEAPHRLLEAISDLVEVFGADREAVVARELTKIYETIHGDTLGGLAEWLGTHPEQRKGEAVLVIRGAALPERVEVDAESERVLRLLAAELPLRQAAGLAAEITGLKKNLLYRHAVQIFAATHDE